MVESISKPQSLSQNGEVTHESKTNSMSQAHPSTWTPSSWTAKPMKQEAIYTDRKLVEKSLAKLERLPPIVTPYEIVKLKRSLREVALGKAFLLQGGDCAELFDYCEESAIEAKIKLLLQMSLVLIWGANKPVVRIARMAGQYAKPRSSPTEMVAGKEIPSFRGDILNGFDVEERALDPSRLVRCVFVPFPTKLKADQDVAHISTRLALSTLCVPPYLLDLRIFIGLLTGVLVMFRIRISNANIRRSLPLSPIPSASCGL